MRREASDENDLTQHGDAAECRVDCDGTDDVTGYEELRRHPGCGAGIGGQIRGWLDRWLQ